MTKQEILDHFKDINEAYNDCTRLDSLARMLNEVTSSREWIPVSERLPEEHDTIFAKLRGTKKWHSAMPVEMSDDVRVVVVFSDGTRRVSHSHTVDGKWECEKSHVERTVTHWMQNPELPKNGGRDVRNER